MESRLSPSRMHRDHEPRMRKSLEINRGVFRFMERPYGISKWKSSNEPEPFGNPKIRPCPIRPQVPTTPLPLPATCNSIHPTLTSPAMLKSSARSAIRLRGVRHNNLKNFDLDLPLNQLIVITGLSGSGKSSLAFDTLFAEGQRRYIETFSPYARQFFDRMDKPQVDSIEAIPPAIAIEQRNAVRTTRSTVGTMTEICDYMKMLWPHLAQLHCRQCGQPVRKESPQQIWEMVWNDPARRDRMTNDELLITFDLPLSEKLSFEESLALISKQGYQRLLVDGQIVRLDELLTRRTKNEALAVSQ